MFFICLLLYRECIFLGILNVFQSLDLCQFYLQLFCVKNMSKKRDVRSQTSPYVLNKYLPREKNRNLSMLSATESIKSKFIPDQSKRFSDTHQIDYTAMKKEKLFNSNIAKYRPLFNTNDSSQLPFMSSLRKAPRSYFKANMKNQTTETQPFSTAQKSTFNMTIRKNVSDIFGKNKRKYESTYRWHNNSGVNNKQSTNFQCALRDYNKSWLPNPEQQNFDIVLRPIKYQDVQPKMYEQKQCICPRQKKLLPII